MQYLLDTVAVVRHFTGNRKIGKRAAHILNRVEKHGDLLTVSVISLMEIMYLAERNRIAIKECHLNNFPIFLTSPSPS